MRTISIPVADRAECVQALDTAFTLGQKLNADVVGYHMVPEAPAWEDRFDMASLWAGGTVMTAPWPVDDAATRQKLASHARKLFNRVAKAFDYAVGTGPGSSQAPLASYHEIKGTPDQAITRFGPASDLLVVSRPASKGGMKAWIVMLSALLDSNAPVLILPQKKHHLDTDRIAIAWNNGATEAMLVRAAVPLLQTAREVTFITAGDEGRKGPTAKDMIDYLGAHGIKAKQKKAKGKSAAKAIEAMAGELKAGLLLSGGYTRGRMRELVLGGVTEYLLTKSSLPVLMLHK